MDFKKIIKNKKFIVGAVVVVVAILTYLIFFSGNKTQVSYADSEVKKDTLIASVSGTGQVSGENQIDVKPLTSGVVVSVNVESGQNVEEGQTIAVLDQRSASIQLTQARASLQTAQANYDKLINGATSQDINVSKISVSSAQLSLENSYQDLLNKINSAYTQADDAVRKQTNGLFVNPETNSPTLIYQTNNNQNQIDIINSRILVNGEMDNWKNELNTLGANPSKSDLDAELQKSQSHLNNIKNYLNLIADSLINAIPMSSFPQSSISSYTTSINSTRSSIDSAISSLVSAGQEVKNSQISLNQAQASLDLKQAPARQEDISAANASLLNAQAQYQSAQVNYQNTIIKAPFSGQLGALTIQRGDQVSSAASVATVITNKKIAQISLNEVDIPNVQIGQNVTLTFDAIDNLTIAGKVIEIENVGTATQGVVDYSVKIGFDTQDSRIKSGMSVAASIITNIKQNALIVPSSAVKTQGGQSYVEILDKNSLTSSPTNPSLFISVSTPKRQVVQIGLSNDTQTEIVSGLNEGDLVVTQTVSSATSNSASSNQNRSTIPRIGGGGVMRIGG